MTRLSSVPHLVQPLVQVGEVSASDRCWTYDKLDAWRGKTWDLGR
jgi:hypothetical protein